MSIHNRARQNGSASSSSMALAATRPGWINQDVIPHLVTIDPELKFEDHSEVYEFKWRRFVGSGH